MLTSSQQAILSDALDAVAASQGEEPSWIVNLLADPLTVMAAPVALYKEASKLSFPEIHVLYVQIFAKGEMATSADFKAFFTTARAVSTYSEWNARDLDARYSALSPAEQGPSSFSIAASNLGLPSVDSAKEWFSSLGQWAKWMLIGFIALFALLLANRVAK